MLSTWTVSLTHAESLASASLSVAGEDVVLQAATVKAKVRGQVPGLRFVERTITSITVASQTVLRTLIAVRT